ncbi:GNAT family N-acetyltransferase [Actinomadura sp. DC4]|uniref:GNAT family N-acetyltransferase n=1 Tax=Actinomadura sp. DC4 TaxID=3055069 RepID=UPI0025B09477|nr:GNAT family N-acetyltransferase [Actinomadura sp. DC4]MDN3351917.1 GNAT family N-acetyltransferase [Actinomadura sp. DC4]
MDVRELTTTDDLRAASDLLAGIWRPTDPMPYEMLRVLQHLGGYISGVYEGGALVGACAAFPTADGRLHSHITGVSARGKGAGFEIKRHQRLWALAHGVTAITWTFDPLVRRNAYFNLAKLAARVEEYLPDFYGEMPDELNAGDPSDRLLLSWDLDAPTVAAAVRGEPPISPPAAQVTVLTEDPDGRPAEADPGGAARLAVGTPADIAALRAADPPLALAWRRAQRTALGGALDTGYRVAGFARSGHYLLEAAR